MKTEPEDSEPFQCDFQQLLEAAMLCSEDQTFQNSVSTAEPEPSGSVPYAGHHEQDTSSCSGRLDLQNNLDATKCEPSGNNACL